MPLPCATEDTQARTARMEDHKHIIRHFMVFGNSYFPFGAQDGQYI